MTFIDQVAQKTQDPYYWRMKKREALARVSEFFDNFDDETKTELLMARLVKGEQEYGGKSLTRPRADLLDEIFEEVIDITVWGEIYDAASN